MKLSDLRVGDSGVVEAVDTQADPDPIATRLGELGFVSGEPVRLVARGPLGGDPLLIQVGFTRFALRRAEAERVQLVNGAGASDE